ncbi:MAG: DUF402 domain-containing protein [Thermomicrobiales bacterium]
MPNPYPGFEDHPPNWTSFPPATEFEVVKLAPDGTEAARYVAHMLAEPVPAPWFALGTTWIRGPVHLDGLDFFPGDTMLEYFSPAHWFNAFAVHGPAGEHRGWYANVTYPATLDPASDPPALTWHDLYLDVILLPDGNITVRDEDELAVSGLERSDPKLYAAVRDAKAELVRRASAKVFPFHDARGG